MQHFSAFSSIVFNPLYHCFLLCLSSNPLHTLINSPVCALYTGTYPSRWGLMKAVSFEPWLWLWFTILKPSCLPSSEASLIFYCFSKNPWIPPNSHFLLTGDLFLLFSEGKKKPAFTQGPPLNPQTSVSNSALQYLVARLSWIPVPPTFSSKHHLFSFRLFNLSSSTVFPASFKRLQVSLFIKNPNKPLLQPLTPIIFQLTISLWASFSLQPTFDSIIPLTQLSEAADPRYSSASSCSPPCNTGNWGPLLPSWNPHFPWLVYILPFWLCTCLADALSQVN